MDSIHILITIIILLANKPSDQYHIRQNIIVIPRKKKKLAIYIANLLYKTFLKKSNKYVKNRVKML